MIGLSELDICELGFCLRFKLCSISTCVMQQSTEETDDGYRFRGCRIALLVVNSKPQQNGIACCIAVCTYYL